MDFSNIDFVIVGSGIFGSVLAERLSNDLDKNVLIIEKRNHIGGNCYSEIDEQTGIEYHKYGTHIFHTSNPDVWNYINRFTKFNSYFHQVLTTYKDKVYQMPINLETINSFYNVNLKPYEVTKFLEFEINKEKYEYPSNFEEKAISLIGRPLYEAFLKGYTKKQWQKEPKELPTTILTRLPFRTNYNESYFYDVWQGIPDMGYTEIFKKMLSSEKIHVLLNKEFNEIKELIPQQANIIYTGAIDQFYNYCQGKLEWRSLKFESEVIKFDDFQGTSVMNYAEEDVPFTRIHEPKHLHPERRNNYPKNNTLIIKEFSITNNNDPYYPVNDEKNQKIFEKYKEISKLEENLIFGGRLGNYKYYDMHHSIEIALSLFNKIKEYNNSIKSINYEYFSNN